MKFIKLLAFSSFIGLSFISNAQDAPSGRPAGGMPPGGIPNGGNNTLPTNTAPKGNGKITGYVIDSMATQAVEFANIALFNKATNKPVDGTVADVKGKFTLSKLAAGEYKLIISFLGYNSYTLNSLVIEKGKEVDLGVVKLTPSVKQLAEVTVTGVKSLIEEKVDRLVYNAEKDLSARGGDAADVLKKVPMLSVDLDGNVSLRGSSNIRVLINNKPSTIVAGSVADALKQIPADMIKTVEVITSPSAKYDAEGSAGIINIITKKTTLEGLTLNVDSGVGNRASNLGLNGSYRKGKMGLNLSGFGRAFYNKASTTLEQNSTQNGLTTKTLQSSNAFDNGLFGQYTLGLDYDISKNQSLAANARFGVRNFTRDQDQTTNLFSDVNLYSTAFRDIQSKDLSNSIDLNIDYLRTFKPRQEWSVSTQYSQNNLTNNFTSDQKDIVGDILNRSKNINLNTNKELTFQTDYQTPIGETQLIEVGAKGIFRTVNSNYEYQLASSAADAYSSDATRPAGYLNYNQNIAATYLSYTLTTKSKYSIKVGSRYELTSIDAVNKTSTFSIPSYSNLVPSINISKNFGEGSSLKLAYNRRIQRPGLQQLNPNVNTVNAQSITVGNPLLSPELTDNIELGLSTNIKKTYLNISFYARQTNNAISQIRTQSDTAAGVLITTYQNIGKQIDFGTNIFGNIYITPKWSLNGGLDINHAYLEGQIQDATGKYVTSSNSGFVVSGRLMTQLQLPNGWGLQAFSFMRGNQVTLQGTQIGTPMYSLGIRKDFNEKKGSIGIAGENFLGNGMRMTSTLNSAMFNQTNTNYIYNQSVKITFSYKIGKMSFAAPKKTRSVNNDDLKGEGGGNTTTTGGR